MLAATIRTSSFSAEELSFSPQLEAPTGASDAFIELSSSAGGGGRFRLGLRFRGHRRFFGWF